MEEAEGRVYPAGLAEGKGKCQGCPGGARCSHSPKPLCSESPFGPQGPPLPPAWASVGPPSPGGSCLRTRGALGSLLISFLSPRVAKKRLPAGSTPVQPADDGEK